jgi:hypothetical protein
MHVLLKYPTFVNSVQKRTNTRVDRDSGRTDTLSASQSKRNRLHFDRTPIVEIDRTEHKGALPWKSLFTEFFPVQGRTA